MRILLTGFRPWGSNRKNPSGEVARALGGHVLPVNYDAAGRRLIRLLRSERPAGVLMLGLDPAGRSIRLEKVAMNTDHHEGLRWCRPIVKGGPFTLHARLPIDRLHRRMKRARIPVTISHHAGTFICNHVFYLGLARTKGPCGFVHLPPEGRVALDKQIRAVGMILGEMGPAA